VTAIATCVAGCERTELLGVVDTTDAAVVDPLVPDKPRIVKPLNDPDARDTDPTFTEDLRELYFMSDRTGDKRIWRSLRPTSDDPWGTPTLVTELNTAGQNENPFVSNDGLTIWFFTDRDRTISAQWRSTRTTRDDPWGEPAPVEGLVFGEGSSDVAVTVDPSETLFILNSKPSGPPPYRLYRLERATASDPLGPPMLMDDVVSESSEYDPDMRRNGLFLAFDSTRAEPRQIYWTRRDDRSSPFDPPVPVPALAGQSSDDSAAFSEDLRYVMFSSNRTGNIEIYEVLLSTPLF
jgi:hypothetical protein